MRGDVLKHVRPGDPLDIKAATWNLMIDAARVHSMGRTGDVSSPSAFQHTTVQIKNTTGEDRERFDVLCLDGVLFTNDDNEDEFKNNFSFKGKMPADIADEGKFVVLLEPLADGAIGYGIIAGVTVARLDVHDDEDTFADVRADEPILKTAKWGSAKILYKEDGTGEKWGVVALGVGCHFVLHGTLSGSMSSGGSGTATVNGQSIAIDGSAFLSESLSDGEDVMISKTVGEDAIYIGHNCG